MPGRCRPLHSPLSPAPDPMRFASRAASLLLFAGVLLALARPVRAQRLVGYVLEEGTEQPVVAAEIVIIDPSGAARSTAVTDSAGWFQLAMTEGGTYRVRVSHIAYTPFGSEPLELGRGETVEIQIRLGRTVIPLEPLIVTARSRESGRLAEFRERVQRNAFGRFLEREDIENRAAFRVTDLLRMMSGVRIVPVRRGPSTANVITMRGGAAGNCSPNVYIDGVRVTQSQDFPIDDLLLPEMLEGVEIYSTTAGAPVQYQQDPRCGVVLFWTRQGEDGRPFSWKRLLLGAGIAAVLIFFAH